VEIIPWDTNKPRKYEVKGFSINLDVEDAWWILNQASKRGYTLHSVVSQSNSSHIYNIYTLTTAVSATNVSSTPIITSPSVDSYEAKVVAEAKKAKENANIIGDLKEKASRGDKSAQEQLTKHERNQQAATYKFRIKVTQNIRKMSPAINHAWARTQSVLDFWENPRFCPEAASNDAKQKQLIQDISFKGKRAVPFFLFEDPLMLMDKSAAAAWVTAIEDCGGKAETIEVTSTREWDPKAFENQYLKQANTHLKMDTPPPDETALPENLAVKGYLENWASVHKIKIPPGQAPTAVLLYQEYTKDTQHLFPQPIASFLSEYLAANGAKVSLVVKS